MKHRSLICDVVTVSEIHQLTTSSFCFSVGGGGVVGGLVPAVIGKSRCAKVVKQVTALKGLP